MYRNAQAVHTKDMNEANRIWENLNIFQLQLTVVEEQQRGEAKNY